MTALGDGAQAHRHLLHEIGHGSENDKEPQKMCPVLRARCSVGSDAASVVVGDQRIDKHLE